MAFKPLIRIACDECNKDFSFWGNSEHEANLKILSMGWAVFNNAHYCDACAKERFNGVSLSDFRDMLMALDDLANGRGLNVPIEVLIDRFKGKLK